MILQNGNTLTVTCDFEHIGAAFVGAKIRASIGKEGAFGFNEVLHSGDVPVAGIVDDVNWTAYRFTVTIPIQNIGTLGVEPGTDYEVEVKLMSIPGSDIFWHGPPNDITLEAPLEEAEFRDLTVTYQKT